MIYRDHVYRKEVRCDRGNITQFPPRSTYMVTPITTANFGTLKMMNLASLPLDILLRILERMTVQDILRVGMVRPCMLPTLIAIGV
jgi:hypothetical protein